MKNAFIFIVLVICKNVNLSAVVISTIFVLKYEDREEHYLESFLLRCYWIGEPCPTTPQRLCRK